MLVQQRQPIIQFDEYKQFLGSQWVQQNYLNDLQGIDCPNILVKCVENNDHGGEGIYIDQEQLAHVKTSNYKALLLSYFIYGYHITYIEKQNFHYHFYKKFHQTIILFQKSNQSAFYSIIDPSSPISKSIFLECIIMLLYQTTQLLIVSDQPLLNEYLDDIDVIQESKLFYKLSYVGLMEQMKELLFKCQVEGQTLITICINHLLYSEPLYQNLLKEQEIYIRTYDTKFMTQLMKLFILSKDMPLHISRQIIRQIFTLNEQQQNFQISKQILKNLIYSNDIILCLETIQIWLKSKHWTVFQQIRQFLDELFKHSNNELKYDEVSTTLLFDLLVEIQKIGFIDGQKQQDELMDELILIFHMLWQSFENETKEEYYEKKTELWLNYIYKLNQHLNPLTPVQNSQNDTKGCLGLYLILYDINNTKKYISSASILVHFIDTLYPLEQTTIKQSLLIQNFVKSSIEFIVDSNLKEQNEIFQIIEKVLRSVQYLNPNFKQKIFQLIWSRWLPEDSFYLKILQQIVQIFLESEDQQLGTRNSFFISILAMESSKKIVHPQKFHTLLQICQYLCLENAPVNMESIFSQHDTYANCLYLKQYKIKKSFQEFFQVNNYYSLIITLIAGIQNTTNLVYILKEFIKLEWLLTEGLKLAQVEFADEFVTFLEQKLYLFSDEQTKELMELLFDCSVSMISRFMRLKNVSNAAEKYGEVIIQNEFCLKVLVEVFLFNTQPSVLLRINLLQLVGILIISNEYNQMIFREAVRLSNFLQCLRNQKNKDLQNKMEEVLKRSLSFIRNDQIQKLIQNAPKDPQKNKVFRQSAFSQYVGATLENLQNSGKETKGKRSFQLLGRDSGIVMKNYCDFSKKNWRSFTIFIEYKREGFHFINSSAREIEETFKREQVLFNLSGHIEKQEKQQANNASPQKPNLQQIDFIQISLINQWMDQDISDQTQINPLENRIKLSILNNEQQLKEYFLSYTQQTKDEQILLMLMIDEKSKGIITIKVQNQIAKFQQIKTFIPEYIKKYSDKHHLSISLGAYYNNQSFLKTFQGIVCNFAIIEGFLLLKQIEAIYQRSQNNLIEIIEKETMNFSVDDAVESREMQYLDLEKFKTSFQLVEIKDAIKTIKAQNIQDQSFLMHMLKKQVQHKITYESNQEVKVFYQGANIIEDVGLAEVFLSLENIEIILFIIQITTQTYFDLEPLERRQSKLRSVKLVLQNNGLKGQSSKGVYKRTNYFDLMNRQIFFIKDLKKNRDDYLNCQQYQQKLMKQNSSTISQTESPGQQRKNFLMLENDSNQNSIVITQQAPAVSQFNADEIQQSLFNIPLTQINTAFSQDHALQIQLSHDSEPKQHSPTQLPDPEIPKFISTNQNFVMERVFPAERKISAPYQPFQRKNTKHLTYNNTSPKRVYNLHQFPKPVESDKQIRESPERESLENDPNQYYSEWIRVKMQLFGELKVLEKDRVIEFISEGKERPEKEFFVYGTIPQNLKLIKKKKVINLNQILEIQTRRYSHKEIAVEIFCKNTKSYFFVLYDIEKRQQFLNLMKQCNIINIVTDRRAEFCSKEYTKKWIKGKISNFQYLMLINKYAGRSFNDLNQYPIFPWVLSDYKSKSIDLNNKDVYRDLEKMIGTINKDRLENCKIRAETLRQTQNECFLFGSHYSVAAQIINTLVRIEPFTTLQCELQDGKLDQPDRIFFSIPNTWDSCQHDNQDFRELIPEYFYLPEFLKNINQIQFGSRQNNELVDDCVLPPWAPNSEAFIEINRRALESCFVSEKLHCWINLMFGPCAQGEEAKKRDNLYHPLTYDTCWQQLEKLPYEEKLGYLSQIQQFGQVPFQLFTKPHWPKQKIELNLFSPLNLIKILSEKKIASAKRIAKLDKKLAIKIYRDHEILYALLNNKQVYKFKHGVQQDRRDSDDNKNNFTFSIGEVDRLHIESCCILKEMVSPIKAIKNTKPSHPTGLQFQFDDNMLFVSGYVSGAVYIYNLHHDKQQSLISHKIKLHKKRVTCLSYSSKLKLLCLGAKDNRVTVWKLNSQTEKQLQFFQTPKFILYGHDKSISCVLLDDILQVVISLDKTGKLQIHSAISGVFLNEIKIDLAISERIWNIVSNGNGMIVLLTNHSELIAMNVNGLVIQRYCYNNIGNITQISFYQLSNLLVSTQRGEILLIADITFLTEQHPIIFHVYQNTSNNGIITFSQFIENDSLVLIISLMDGQICRYQINAEQNPEFANYLGRLGM